MDLAENIKQIITKVDSIPLERIEVLTVFVTYLRKKIADQEAIKLNFVCTHNSRRSQLSQIWAQTAADYYGIECDCFSSGVEVTAFNYRAVHAIENAGFQIQKGAGNNPIYEIQNGLKPGSIRCFSKLLNDPENPSENFAAVMTCSHADENCPVVSGMEARIRLNYEDPGKYDGSDLETAKYQERSEQIASEMFYVFSKL